LAGRVKFSAALAFAAACVALSGCSKTSAPATGHLNPAGYHTVRLAINSEPNSLNPILQTTYQEAYVEEAIFNGLLKYDANENLIPDLAIEVPSLANGGISRDGKAITYHLRRGVRWHDGRPFTSADVAFSFAATMDPKTNDVYRALYGQAVRIDTPDPYTAIFRLRSPFAEALSDFFSGNTSTGIIPKHLYEHSSDINRDYYNDHPVGTGPYRLVRWDHGSLLILKANTAYFGGAPKIDEIDIRIVPNQNTLIAMIAAHDLDVATQVAPTELERVRRLAGVRTMLARTYVERFIIFNVTHPPFDDPRVRRALAMALDRKRIAQTASIGIAVPADSIVPPYSWAYVAGNGSLPYDPAAAKALLDAAGWIAGPDGVRTKAGKQLVFGLVNQNEQAALAKMAVEIQAQWRAIGAVASVQNAPRNVIFGFPGIETDGKFDAAIDNSATDADPDRSVYITTGSKAPHGFNFSRYSDPDVDAWSAQALATYDRSVRARYYALIQRRVNRDAALIPLAWDRWIYAVDSRLSGVEPETIGSDFWNVERWDYSR
jgi:peptide/nickel transport system substrate-binding protein